MNKDKLITQLSRDEGRVAYAYKDSLGYLTIGVGHLIDKAKGGSLPDSIIDALLSYDIDTHANELFSKLPWVKDLDEARQGVLINMAFNLGVDGLLAFKNTLALIKAGKYSEASLEMLDSAWAKQVGDRSKRLSNQMRDGKWY